MSGKIVELDKDVKKRNNLYGLLILFAIFLPMVMAYIMFKTGWGVSSNTTNKGQLLTEPVAVNDLSLKNNDDRFSVLYPSDKKQWRILVPVTSSCGEACQNNLYVTRQVHIRLAEKAYRVERVLLLLDTLSNDELENLEREHPSTLVFKSSQASLTEWLTKNALPLAPDQYFYLIDQNGFAMMRYGVEHTGHDLLDDLKKLLKFTYDK
ncbi:MAG: hypothetical protein ACRBCI_04925 [Cellvibrionaceae bacterium]